MVLESVVLYYDNFTHANRLRVIQKWCQFQCEKERERDRWSQWKGGGRGRRERERKKRREGRDVDSRR